MADDPFAKYTAAPDPADPFAKYAGTKPEDTGPKPGLLESFGRGAAEGATFGYDDEVGFDKGRREASQKANPWTHFAGEIAGGLVPMVAAAVLPTGIGQAAAAGRAAQIAGKGFRLARGVMAPGEIATTGQALTQGVKLGTVYGGASGSGHADVKEDDSWADAAAKRATGALKGATIGAAVGAPLGIAGHGIYRGAQAIGNLRAGAAAETADAGKGALVTATRKLEEDRVAPQQIIDNILAEFPSASDTAKGGLARRFWGDMKNPQPITREQVEQVVAMAARDMGPGEISTALSPGGKGTGPGPDAIRSLLGELEQRHLGPLNLVDRAAMVRPGSGDNTQMTLRAAAATPGDHVGIAREALLERQVGAQGRFAQLFDRMLGSSDYEGVAAGHAEKLSDAGTRAYGAAFQNEQPFNIANVLEQWSNRFGSYSGKVPDAINAWLRAFMTQGQNKGPVADLRGFMYAREGLRDAIETAKKDQPNLARHLTRLYNDLTEPVTRTNPAWKTANDIWRDGKAAQEAMEAGARMSTRLSAGSRQNLVEYTSAQADAAKATEQLLQATQAVRGAGTRRAPNAQELAVAPPEQRLAVEQAQARLEAANARQELFKVGLVRSLNDMLLNQGETHDASRRILLPGAQKMLRQVLGADADQFFNVVRAEQAMARTYKAQFGSQTTPLAEAVKEQTWAPRFEANMSMLNPFSWLNPALRLAQEYGAHTINARRNTDLMRLYTQTDPLKQLEALRAMQSLHKARSDWGNYMGRPAVGLGAGALPEAIVAGQSEPARAPLKAPWQP